MDITPEFKIIPFKDKLVFPEQDEFMSKVGGMGGTLASSVAGAINNEGQVVADVVNSKLDTESKYILGEFTFSGSGALAINTDANNGLWISPTGILAKNLGANTLTVTNQGNVTMSGTITATAGSIGGWNISATAIYYDGATDAVSAGMASADYPFYAGKKYASRATAPFRVTPAGIVYATGAVIDGTTTIGGRLVSTIASAIDSSGHFIDNVLNTSSQTILKDFVFTGTDYAGALKTGTIAWNSTTGRVTSGTGILINSAGIMGALNGSEKFTILTDGSATFSGTLSGASGTFGAITAGTIQGCSFKTAADGNNRIEFGTGGVSDIHYSNTSNKIVFEILFGIGTGEQGKVDFLVNNSDGTSRNSLRLDADENALWCPDTTNKLTLGTTSFPWSIIHATQINLSSTGIRLGGTNTPASASAAGNAGTICYDESYFYVCIASGNWRRVAHSSW